MRDPRCALRCIRAARAKGRRAASVGLCLVGRFPIEQAIAGRAIPGFTENVAVAFDPGVAVQVRLSLPDADLQRRCQTAGARIHHHKVMLRARQRVEGSRVEMRCKASARVCHISGDSRMRAPALARVAKNSCVALTCLRFYAHALLCRVPIVEHSARVFVGKYAVVA